jgi:putative sterol carrier protein
MVSKTNNPTPKAKRAMGFPAAADKAKADSMAEIALRSSANAGVLVVGYTPLGDQDLGAVVAALSEDILGVQAGDLRPAEAMLYGQAHALQAIFINLARKATGMNQLKQWDAFLRMALKAQNQCLSSLRGKPTSTTVGSSR